MSVTRTIRYEGNPAFASILVQALRGEGVDVEWTPPEEKRFDPVTTIIIPLVVRGAYDAIMAGLKKFRDKRLPDTQVEIEDDEKNEG